MQFNSDSTRWGILIVAGVLLTVLVYGQIADQIAEIEQNTPSVPVRWHASGVVKGGPRLSNPASTHCIQIGGRSKIMYAPVGGQYGVCEFANGDQCEEWALLRGSCPQGGISTAKLRTPAGKYCVITGGAYHVIKAGDVRTEVGTCTPVGGGEPCDATAYWFGQCPLK